MRDDRARRPKGSTAVLAAGRLCVRLPLEPHAGAQLLWRKLLPDKIVCKQRDHVCVFVKVCVAMTICNEGAFDCHWVSMLCYPSLPTRLDWNNCQRLFRDMQVLASEMFGLRHIASKPGMTHLAPHVGHSTLLHADMKYSGQSHLEPTPCVLRPLPRC